MRYFKIKNLLKISIISILLIMCVGVIYATDNTDINSINPQNSIISDLDDALYELDDSDLDVDDSDLFLDDVVDDLDEFDDSDLDFDVDDLDEFDDSDLDFDVDDLDEFDDSDLDFDDLGYYESFGDFNLEDIDYVASKGLKSFDYLEFKIISYLDQFGNSDENWTESDEFLAEYKLYLDNSSNYVLNKSNDCYELYLKIYDSIVSNFGEYNLTQNETDYLNFLIIFYLNHFGNCSNGTWDESCNFATYHPPYYLTMVRPIVAASGSAPDGDVDSYKGSGFHIPGGYGNVIYSNILSNSTDSNYTQLNNSTMAVTQKSNDGLYNLFMVLFVIVMMILVII